MHIHDGFVLGHYMDAPLKTENTMDAPHLTQRRPPGAEVSQAAAVASGERPEPTAGARRAKLWMPKQIYVTKDAANEEHGQRIMLRLRELGLEYELLKGNRLPSMKGLGDVRDQYRAAKDTLAIVNAPPSQLKLQPIPPSADYQFHLAKGCPAHCQYCYLAGSLSGPPMTRVYANLDTILSNVADYAARGTDHLKRRPADAHTDLNAVSFEASCYTDPLALEHLTGSLSTAIEAVGKMPNGRLRWVTKYDMIEPLLGLNHNRRTRCRISLNADIVARRLEGGTASLAARLQAMRQLALSRAAGGGGYQIGAVLAPLMPIPDWREAYSELLVGIEHAVAGTDAELTFELITHRFTPGSKEVLLDWYPATKLDLNEENRAEKRNKFGGKKLVYNKEQMLELKTWFTQEIEARFGPDRVLYFT